MPYFILNKTRQANSDHEVHNKTTGCPWMPLVENQIDLGWHLSSRDAVAHAKKQYPDWKIDGCSHCCKDSHKS